MINQDTFKAIGADRLIKVYLKTEKGLVKDRVGRIQNFVFGFVKESSTWQDLILAPRSFDDRITHNIVDGSEIQSPDESEFFVWYNDIEKFEIF